MYSRLLPVDIDQIRVITMDRDNYQEHSEEILRLPIEEYFI